jgi:hypothetical protein
MAIRLTFFTSADDFRGQAQSADHWRSWMRGRGWERSVVTEPDGSQTDGPSVDDVAEEDLARWVAATALKEAIEKGRNDGYLNVHRGENLWVSMRANLVQAIEAEVVEDAEIGSSDLGTGWPLTEESAPVH